MASKSGAGKLTTAGSLNVGVFNVNAGSLVSQGAVDIGRLNVAGGLKAQFFNAAANSGASKSIDVLQLGDGAVFETNDRAEVTDATTIGNVTLASGSATVQDVYNSGYYMLESLSLAEGVESRISVPSLSWEAQKRKPEILLAQFSCRSSAWKKGIPIRQETQLATPRSC